MRHLETSCLETGSVFKKCKQVKPKNGSYTANGLYLEVNISLTVFNLSGSFIIPRVERQAWETGHLRAQVFRAK